MLGPVYDSMMRLRQHLTLPCCVREYWRFFSAIFVHSDLLHLLVFLITFQTVARPVAEIFGGLRFLVIYILSGALGYLSSYLHNTSPAMGGTASIMGLIGALIWFDGEHQMLLRRAETRRILFTIVWLLIDGFIALYVDNWSHLGGLLGGMLLAALIGPNLVEPITHTKPRNWKSASGAFLQLEDRPFVLLVKRWIETSFQALKDIKRIRKLFRDQWT